MSETIGEQLAEKIHPLFKVDWGTNDVNGTECFTVDTPAIAALIDAALQSATELGPCGKHWKGDWVTRIVTAAKDMSSDALESGAIGEDNGYCRTCAEINQLREQRDNALTELTEVRGFWKAARDGALERTAAAMAQQRGTIANWFKSNPIYISVVNTNLLVKDILAVPLASAESQEWLEKHDVEVAKAWVAHTRDAHQAELRQQLAMARLDEAKWWIAMQKLDIADLFGDEEHRYKQLESEAQAREGEVKS